jgi:hypothetical protein
MKTTAKDIILLCKGWYNEQIYPTISDALKEYYCENYMPMPVDGKCEDEEFLLETLLLQVIQEIEAEYPDRLNGFIKGFIHQSLIKNILLDELDAIHNVEIFYYIINFLKNLPLQGANLVTIDTDDYFTSHIADGEEIVELKMPIIN